METLSEFLSRKSLQREAFQCRERSRLQATVFAEFLSEMSSWKLTKEDSVRRERWIERLQRLNIGPKP